MARKTSTPPDPTGKQPTRQYVKQADVPAMELDDALRVPQAILDHYAGKPTTPLFVAKALNVDPKGSQFRLLTGAAIAFGLVDGGAQATQISVTDLARRILRPTADGMASVARREAVLKPRVFREFLESYDTNQLPREDLAVNVLETMGLARERSAEVFVRIVNSARSVGLLQEINGKGYVSLAAAGDGAVPAGSAQSPATPVMESPVAPAAAEDGRVPDAGPFAPRISPLAQAIGDDERRRKVFITHGKNRELVEPIKKLLEFGEMTPVVSVDRQSVSKPVPEKVMDDMRACGAAIIHVDVDQTITDSAGQETVLLNPNVLIEIGAAMAFYGRRFILLVRDGVKLPSNLQGLYEVRYAGEAMDASATIRLLEAIKDIKNYALPTDPRSEDVSL